MITTAERTLAIIKPDASSKEDDIVWAITQLGFKVLNKRRLTLTTEQASEFYAIHADKAFFGELVKFMTSGPIVAIILQKQNAVEDWRKALGPTDSIVAKKQDPKSIRALFGTDKQRNACHGSDSTQNADKEIRFFFPDALAEPLPSNEEARMFLEGNLYPTLTKGLTELCKEKPANPTAWLGNWLLANNPHKPKVEEPNN